MGRSTGFQLSKTMHARGRDLALSSAILDRNCRKAANELGLSSRSPNILCTTPRARPYASGSVNDSGKTEAAPRLSFIEDPLWPECGVSSHGLLRREEDLNLSHHHPNDAHPIP